MEIERLRLPLRALSGKALEVFRLKTYFAYVALAPFRVAASRE